MNEEDLKKLMDKSRLETSADFTDKLLDRIEQDQALNVQKPWSFKFVLLAMSSILVLGSFVLFYLKDSALEGANLGLVVFAIFMMIGGLIMNQLLKVQRLASALIEPQL